MILFTILLIILLILCVIALAALVVGGVVGYILFGDLIICIMLVVWIMRRHYKKKQK